MIYLRLSGGLGNQLFQFAAVALLSQIRKSEVTVLTDALHDYESPREPDSLKLLNDNTWFRVAKPEERDVHCWLTSRARAGRLFPFLGVNDRNFWTNVTAAIGRVPLYVDGYFQRGWTQETFSRATSAMKIQQISTHAINRLKVGEVAIHIRGRDFLKLPRYQVVSAPFYIEAVRQAMSQGFTRFAVLTDDPPYATDLCEDIQNKCVDFSFRMLGQEENSTTDFFTLRGAAGRIIGNSTFAWWAAALDKKSAPTWAPTKFTIDRQRDFYLANEIAVAAEDCTT